MDDLQIICDMLDDLCVKLVDLEEWELHCALEKVKQQLNKVKVGLEQASI